MNVFKTRAIYSMLGILHIVSGLMWSSQIFAVTPVATNVAVVSSPDQPTPDPFEMFAALNVPKSEQQRWMLIGPELTVTNHQLNHLARENRVSEYHAMVNMILEKWLNEIRRVCTTCKIRSLGKDKYKFEYFSISLPGKIDMILHSDNGVIEAGMADLTIEKLEYVAPLLQKIFWGIALSLDLRPHYRVGGGHAHFDKSHFRGNAQLFRNFMVDLMNRPELFLGGLNLDLVNAPPLAVLLPEQQNSFERVILEFDKNPTGIEPLIKRINEEVYTASYYRGGDGFGQVTAEPSKYQAINLLHAETVEIRGLPPAKSATALIRHFKLFLGRIDSLAGIKENIVYEKRNLAHLVTSWPVDNVMHYSINISDSNIEAALKKYMRDAGQDLRTYKKLKYLGPPRTSVKQTYLLRCEEMFN